MNSYSLNLQWGFFCFETRRWPGAGKRPLKEQIDGLEAEARRLARVGEWQTRPLKWEQSK
jgi:hypothetical protein